jgi:hypothetical protein
MLLLIATFTTAQPTITTAELPIAGTGWVTANDTSYLSAILPGGANANWNYAGLQNHGTDTTLFLSAAGTPYENDFPGSNLVIDDGSGGWTYFTANSSGLSANGTYDPSFGVVNLTPPSIYCPVPFTFNDTRSATSSAQIDVDSGGTNLRINLSIQSTLLADGYGSLTLPNRTYTNVLRIKSTDLTTFTISIELIAGTGIYVPVNSFTSQSTNFRHYRTGSIHSLLLEVNGDSLGTYATGASYLYSTNVSVDELGAGSLSVQPYPNPSSGGYLTIPLPVKTEATFAEITSLDGRTVTVPVNNLSDRALLFTDALANGIYIFRIGTLSGRFSIQR